MESIPTRNGRFDLVIAHGIWNLARSAAQFRRALGEAARVAKPGAGLFVFTFSRNTFPLETKPVAREPFVFTQFSDESASSQRPSWSSNSVVSASRRIPVFPSASTTDRSRGHSPPGRCR